MKKKIANLLHKFAEWLSPSEILWPEELNPEIRINGVFTYVRTGYEYPKEVKYYESSIRTKCINFDQLKTELAQNLGKELLRQNLLSFYIDPNSEGYRFCAEVYAARPPRY